MDKLTQKRIEAVIKLGLTENQAKEFANIEKNWVDKKSAFLCEAGFLEAEKLSKIKMESNFEIVKSFLEYQIKIQNGFIKPTETDKRQFELNFRSSQLSKYLSHTLDYINNWETKIGTEVYKYVDRFGYSEKIMADVFNKTVNTPLLFTKELFEELILNIIEYKIKYFSEMLTDRPITCNSTCKFTNLEFEWSLECYQELIKFHKELLYRYTK